MFLIDNDVVRSGWARAKAIVTDLIAKHGGEVHSSRRWDERLLAYPVKRRRRATYLRVYYGIPGTSIGGFLRDLEINETVLRHLQLRVETVPAEELELSRAEEQPDFSVPEPPADDAVEVEVEVEEEAAESEAKTDADEKDADEKQEKADEKGQEDSGKKEPEPALASGETEEKKEG
jgi:ribosomal protein S6